MMMNARIEGGCLCGGLRYRLHEQPKQRSDCHCIDCRRASGAPFVTWGAFRREKIELVSGELRKVKHAGRLRSFASCCGTPLFIEDDEASEWVDVTISSFDQPENYSPEATIWTEDRLPWVSLNPERRTYERDRESNGPGLASNIPTANPADVASVDAIISAAYDVISGPAGQKRDWNRERSLFIPGARLIPTAKNAGEGDQNGEIAPQVLNIDGYIARVGDYLEKNGFFETEIARRTEQFGRIAHVWSTYESRHTMEDSKPFMRGINSIQLFHDGNRWWIVNIYWQHESVDVPIAEKYLEMIKD